MATVAVFISLGGTGYAAVKINGSQIRNRSITAVKIQRGALTSREVRSARVAARTQQLFLSRAHHKKRHASASSADDLQNSLVKLSIGETKSLLDVGSFHLMAKCVENPNQSDLASTAILGSSDIAGTLTDAWFDDNGRLNPGETTVFARPTEASTIAISPERATFIAPDGQTLSVRYIYGENALGADCFASAYAIG